MPRGATLRPPVNFDCQLSYYCMFAAVLSKLTTFTPEDLFSINLRLRSERKTKDSPFTLPSTSFVLHSGRGFLLHLPFFPGNSRFFFIFHPRLHYFHAQDMKFAVRFGDLVPDADGCDVLPIQENRKERESFYPASGMGEDNFRFRDKNFIKKTMTNVIRSRWMIHQISF